MHRKGGLITRHMYIHCTRHIAQQGGKEEVRDYICIYIHDIYIYIYIDAQAIKQFMKKVLLATTAKSRWREGEGRAWKFVISC